MTESELIRAEDRVALLQQGIVVVEAETVEGRIRVGVTGGGAERVLAIVADRLGEDTEVEVLGDLPRRLVPRPCVGHMEREAGRLQLRFVLWHDEHVDEIFVAEDVTTVAVLGTVCSPETGDAREACEVPCHVYLGSPLGDRAVEDGVTDRAVPHKNVYATLGA